MKIKFLKLSDEEKTSIIEMLRCFLAAGFITCGIVYGCRVAVQLEFYKDDDVVSLLLSIIMMFVGLSQLKLFFQNK